MNATPKPKRRTSSQKRHKSGKKSPQQQPQPTTQASPKKKHRGKPHRHKVKNNADEQTTPEYADYKPKKAKVIKYLEFDNHKQAHDAEEQIKSACEGCDQLNLYIKAEGNMDDPEILGMSDKIVIFAGEAWCLIHSRRLEEKWYDHPH